MSFFAMPENESTPTPRAARHPTQNEPLLFERSAPGKRGVQLPPLDVPAADLSKLGGAVRAEIAGRRFSRGAGRR